MEYLGLFFEFAFFLLGLYCYLFALGRFLPAEPKARQRAETFRQRNGRWMRIGGLALMALTAVNLYLHVRQLLGA